MQPMQSVPVLLAPSPAFCVKSTALRHALCPLSPHSPTPNHPISIPLGLKLFVNIAWDPNVPPPPQDPMRGDSLDQSFVPLVVSDPRHDRDKAGNLSAVFDCIYNPSLKHRALRDPDFKTFLIELAFQRIEAHTSLVLSRQISTPNIPSKGKLAPRTALIPVGFYPDGRAPGPTPRAKQTQNAPQKSKKGKLIEEIAPQPAPVRPKGLPAPASASPTTPAFSWHQTGDTLCLAIRVPGLTHADIAGATLDVEPRRVLLHVPQRYALDLDLAQPDAALAAALDAGSAQQALALKRMRALAVDAARAEWRVADGVLAVLA